MSVRAKMAWAAAVAGGVIFLGRPDPCPGATPPPPAFPAFPSIPTAAPGPAAASPAPAEDGGNPYSVIVDRNVFRLSPPPPPPDKDPRPPPDLPVVKLSGFIQVANDWKVLLAVTVKSGDGKSQDTSYLTMKEGEKSGVVELVKVYPGDEKVEIVDSGTPMTLSMKENGFLGGGAAPAAGGRGGPAALRPAATPLGQPPPVPPATLPKMGVVPQFDGANNGGDGNTFTGSSMFNRGPITAGNQTPFGGGGVVNPIGQPQPTSYQPGDYNARGYGVISGNGGMPTAAPATTPIVPISPGPNNLSHLVQPNSTPAVNDGSANIEMPPMPNAPR